MRTHPVWYRLCVDVDPLGRVLGLSYEVHTNDERTSIVVSAVPPEVHDYLPACRYLRELVEMEHGVQLELWP